MNRKTEILCLHGYGKRRGKQFLGFVERFEGRFDIYYPDYCELREDDAKADMWMEKAEAALKGCKGEPILVGFSLGAIIAAHLALEHKIRKLIMISPAFEYDRFLEVKRKNPDPAIPEAYLDVFVQIVDRYGEDVGSMDCPITILHAKEDELIPYEASQRIFAQLESANKKLFLLQGGSHTLLDDPAKKEEVFAILSDELG